MTIKHGHAIDGCRTGQDAICPHGNVGRYTSSTCTVCQQALRPAGAPPRQGTDA